MNAPREIDFRQLRGTRAEMLDRAYAETFTGDAALGVLFERLAGSPDFPPARHKIARELGYSIIGGPRA